MYLYIYNQVVPFALSLIINTATIYTEMNSVKLFLLIKIAVGSMITDYNGVPELKITLVFLKTKIWIYM